MTNIEELIAALDVLKDVESFKDIILIGRLNWKTIPEAYTKKLSIILNGHRLTQYTLKDMNVVEISDIGIFQIM